MFLEKYNQYFYVIDHKYVFLIDLVNLYDKKDIYDVCVLRKCNILSIFLFEYLESKLKLFMKVPIWIKAYFKTIHFDFSSLHYLDLNISWMKNLQEKNILGQNSNILTSYHNQIDRIKVEKIIPTNKLKSKKRRKSLPKKFQFREKESIIEEFRDTRTDFEIFKDCLEIIHKRFEPKHYQSLCRQCKYDIAADPFSKNGVFLGEDYVKKLMKLYKRSYPLSFGDKTKLQDMLKKLGYSREVVADIFEYQNNDTNNLSIQNSGLPDKCSTSKVSYPAESTFFPEEQDQRSRNESPNPEESQHPKQINSNYVNFSFCT